MMERQWQYLKKMKAEGRVPHAVLFSGPAGIGKRNLAFRWISLLLEKELTKNQHPDLILIEPKEKEISISQIRNLIWKLSLKPHSAPLKVAVIDRAHTLNQEAQDALLKLLEEPKGKTLLILITEYPLKLSPTILSRVQWFKFFGTFPDISRKPEKEKRIKELQNLRRKDLGFRFQYAKHLSQDSEALRETLEIWLRYFRQDLFKDIQNLKTRRILSFIQSLHHLISTTNVNPRLALELLMLEI